MSFPIAFSEYIRNIDPVHRSLPKFKKIRLGVCLQLRPRGRQTPDWRMHLAQMKTPQKSASPQKTSESHIALRSVSFALNLCRGG